MIHPSATITTAGGDGRAVTAPGTVRAAAAAFPTSPYLAGTRLPEVAGEGAETVWLLPPLP
ncbi:hypothetical protein KIL84_014931 [Mauremys mutica]|uniref:Uncharacterized protein n=1 Tax=Mauremys mutica TaxID=74926 RepID=A0A9D3XSA1_9SAUR|nr:hypothetical protein KIL84_014931 [Mauremys mutica]